MANLRIWFVETETTSRAKCSGEPAPGAFPATGGNAKPGRATSGTLLFKTTLCATAKIFLSAAWCTICSEAAGSWKGRMTERQGIRDQRLGLVNPSLLTPDP